MYGILSVTMNEETGKFERRWVTGPAGPWLHASEEHAQAMAADMTNAMREAGILNQDYRARKWTEGDV